VSYADVSPAAVLTAIRSGLHTRADLAARFEVLPSSLFLADAIDTVKETRQVVEHEGGELHANDLIEQLPHCEEED